MNVAGDGRSQKLWGDLASWPYEGTSKTVGEALKKYISIQLLHDAS